MKQSTSGHASSNASRKKRRAKGQRANAVPPEGCSTSPKKHSDSLKGRSTSSKTRSDLPKGRSSHGDMKNPARGAGALRRIPRRRTVFLLTLTTLALCCLIFPGVGWWPLAYVCLVPWFVCICTAERPWFLYLTSYLLGVGFFLFNVRWVSYTTPPGYAAIALIYAIVFPLVAWPIRQMYRRHGISVALTAPVVWVAAEYLRSIGLMGFPWLLLAHSQYRCLSVIQISDLVGAYGVSFMMVMVNGWITDLLIQPIVIERVAGASYRPGASRIARLPIGTLATALVVIGTLIYGSAQRSLRPLHPGAKIAVVQHDIPMYVDVSPARQLYSDTIFAAHLALAKKAAADKPDLIVLPETIMPCFINQSFLEAGRDELEEISRRRYGDGNVRIMASYQAFGLRIYKAFQQLSDETHIPIVLGASAVEWKPKETPPRVEAFNSAFLIKPDCAWPAARYDKRHLVMFGEYVPFRYQFPALHHWLNAQTPWGQDGHDYSLTPGDEYVVFQFQGPSDGKKIYRAGVPICYEEIMPYIARNFTRGGDPKAEKKNIDLLISISNDGWFLHSVELEQHLSSAVFRAVENRISVARSVNTGTSGVIYPNGKIHSRVGLDTSQIAKLEDVSQALNHLQDLCQQMEAVISDAEENENESESEKAFRALWSEYRMAGMSQLRDSLTALGDEFLFIHTRLSRLGRGIVVKDRKQRFDAIGVFREQVTNDLSTIQRWRSHPWSAPGYATDTVLSDGRLTIYTRWGDWFAQLTVVISGLMLISGLFRRLGSRRKSRSSQGR